MWGGVLICQSMRCKLQSVNAALKWTELSLVPIMLFLLSDLDIEYLEASENIYSGGYLQDKITVVILKNELFKKLAPSPGRVAQLVGAFSLYTKGLWVRSQWGRVGGGVLVRQPLDVSLPSSL